MIVAVVVAVVVVASERAIKASAASPLKVLAASGCSLANILLWKSVLFLCLSRCRICLTCSIVMLLGVLVLLLPQLLVAGLVYGLFCFHQILY